VAATKLVLARAGYLHRIGTGSRVLEHLGKRRYRMPYHDLLRDDLDIATGVDSVLPAPSPTLQVHVADWMRFAGACLTACDDCRPSAAGFCPLPPTPGKAVAKQMGVVPVLHSPTRNRTPEP
jgi:hypothetical protein